ncbi:hypothetical protein METUNv1_01225 [Methyloversatilis universalis FAM5]|uniref:Uncharacterized protein n=2 Tax=Methyloversatilis universalis TaxID=378211 RepID=F5RAL1_METUF|nr:hypothetical protein METUNv1_01225 [Methyloversatilis universalis FAM5]
MPASKRRKPSPTRSAASPAWSPCSCRRTKAMPSIVREIATLLVCGGALYGGIRADLQNMLVRIEANEASVTRAHARLDQLYERGSR